MDTFHTDNDGSIPERAATRAYKGNEHIMQDQNRIVGYNALSSVELPCVIDTSSINLHCSA